MGYFCCTCATKIIYKNEMHLVFEIPFKVQPGSPGNPGKWPLNDCVCMYMFTYVLFSDC